MHLDDLILKLLQDNKGRIARDKLWKYFNNYSKGYLHGRLQALKYSGLIEEVWGIYKLTRKGKEVMSSE